jgi:hypothetical protein
LRARENAAGVESFGCAQFREGASVMQLPRKSVSAFLSEAVHSIKKAGDFQSRRPFGFL